MSKHISYIVPVEYMTGNISGRQELDYVQGGNGAYAAPDGQKTSATNYDPRLIAKRKRPNGSDDGCLYFQVRTKTSVNMTAAMRLNMAAMGGAGALFASLLRNKTALIYAQCAAATPKGTTMRAFIVPLLIAGLTAKEARITIANNVYIVNPWTSEDVPNVPISLDILNKFAQVLGRAVSPYNAATTEYLLNNYGQYWNKISAFGFDHPSIVPYIEEDNDLIASFVNLGFVRYLVNDSAGSAYIDLGCVGNNDTIAEWDIMFQEINTGKVLAAFGDNTRTSTAITSYTKETGGSTRTSRFGAAATNNPFVAAINTRYAYKQSGDGLYINDSRILTYSNIGTFTTSANLLLFHTNGAGSQYYGKSLFISRFKLFGLYQREMYPFVRNGVPGMIDVLSDTFYTNANTIGAFTIDKIANT